MQKLLKAWRRCQINLRANLVAGLVIWSLGAGIFWGYENSKAFERFLNHTAELKNQYGYLYSAISTSLFGGVLPFLLLLLRQGIMRNRIVSWFLFFSIFWAIKGIEVDAFYRLQSYFLGNSSNWKTVSAKVFIDQFIYCVFWSAPLTALFYGWKDSDFCWAKVRVLKDVGVLVDESLFLLVSTWIIWIPAVSIIYSMPANLQIPLFNLTLCFFVLVITISGKD